jgi:hypothetical protein
LPFETARAISLLPQNAAYKTILAEISKIEKPISRSECDRALRDLAILLPRSNMAPADIDRMLDLYHALLAKQGVTRSMLATACERAVMAPSKDGKRFFPDPGTLFHLCRDDVAWRARRLRALQAAADIVAMATRMDAEIPANFMRARLHEIGESLRARGNIDGE